MIDDRELLKELNKSILDLLVEFELILKSHSEILDTDVRESLHYVLTYYFVWKNVWDKAPKSYSMFTEIGDSLICNAVNQFFTQIERFSISEYNCAIDEENRLSLLQNEGLMTPNGRTYFDFIGKREQPLVLNELPQYLLEEGDYD